MLEGRKIGDGGGDPVLPQPFLHQPQILDEVVVNRRVDEDVFAALQDLRVQGELAAQQQTPLVRGVVRDEVIHEATLPVVLEQAVWSQEHRSSGLALV